MTRRRLFVLVLLFVAVLAACAAGTAAAWLVYTEAGLRWLSSRAVGLAGTGLSLDGVAGTIAGGARARLLRYTGEDIEVRVFDAFLQVSPWSLVTLRPRIVELRASEVAVTTKPGEPRGRPPDTLSLPVDFEVADAKIARLVIDVGEGPYELSDVALEYSGGSNVHRIHRLALSSYGYAAELSGTIDAHAPFALQATVAVARPMPPAANLKATASGTLSALNVDGSLTSGKAAVSIDAQVEPYAALPLAALKARLQDVDLKAFAKDWPHTVLAGEMELERTGVLLVGPVRLTNAAHGRYDQGRIPVAALRVEVRTDVANVRTFTFDADLGSGGAVTGGGSLTNDAAKLTLVTRKLDLSGVHSRMRKTHLAGRADLTLTEARQSIVADLSQDQIAVNLAAEHAGDRVEVSHFRARARGGEARGSANVTLSGKRPFAVEASFARFDPAAWGAFPPGSINGTVQAKGLAEGPEADVQLGIRDSRWLDAPLAAQGTLSVRGNRLREADVTATIGGNDIAAKGTLGAPGDTLAVKFDAPKLGVLVPDVQGAARGNAQLSGSWSAPAIRFELTGTELQYQKLARVKAIGARGELTTDSASPFTVDATLRGVSIPEWQLDSLALRIGGTLAAHTIALDAAGERVDFQARARGGWKQNAGWAGTVEELVNRGEAATKLLAPVRIAIGPKGIHAEPFELSIIGGQFVVSALDYQNGRLATDGRFADLPVRPLLALAGGPAAMAGTLRLNGEWSIKNVPQLTGHVSVSRQSGDLALGDDRGLKLGLQSLSIDGRFETDGATFQASVRSALANATAEGRITPVGSGQQARYTGNSPLVANAAIDVARLAAIASLTDTPMLLDGSAHAKLEILGTLAAAQVTGPVTADGLAIALPAEGIALKDGVLRAVVERNEIRIESFSIRGGEGVLNARGTLARAGFDEASVDWTAEKFMVLTRPDRRLVVSGKGNASLRAGKLAFMGALRADEGLFELSTVSLPHLGDDVVIVGREGTSSAEAERRGAETRAKKTTAAVVDLNVDFGDKVHLRGRGLDVWLSGSVMIQTNAQGELRAVGTVDQKRGTFTVYGQRLDIERGRLYFNGPLDNPGLDFQAMRRNQSVEAGVAVTGTLSQPLVRVVSNPPLPEGEALSWLILGRAPSQAVAGQLSALPLATGALLGKATAPLAGALNVDEVGLRSGEATSEQFLTIGKRISDRVYLAFEQSLGGTESLLRLEMTVTQRVALRAQAGRTSSFGLFYRYSWD